MIAILKYNAGNTTSVENAIKKLGEEVVVTDNITVLKSATKVIFPGVGEASTAMNYLQKRGLDKVIQSLKQPVLGICLGMQLLCEFSEEGNTKGLGIFPLKVRKFPPRGIVPHIGWNNFTEVKNQLFEGISADSDMYFVHSYYAEIGAETVGITDYLLPFSSALQKDNFYAVQFHPEKSAEIGSILLKNFLNL
ncbi:MAG: imidazole glycerol phosphate synthase subunit HisH [Capnocytophaga sp.]|nr:imidazole glycerol phosphate synthase subunit HisH [Capnocytophaga sp.]